MSLYYRQKARIQIPITWHCDAATRRFCTATLLNQRDCEIYGTLPDVVEQNNITNMKTILDVINWRTSVISDDRVKLITKVISETTTIMKAVIVSTAKHDNSIMKLLISKQALTELRNHCNHYMSAIIRA